MVERLQTAGHTTYLVGGCVRDLLLGKHPKDYDIATMAKPNEVRRLIRNAYVIGKRFRLVLVKRGDQQYEVATFRRDLKPDEKTPEEDLPEGDNLFGSPEEDALRRDFTINGLFYDPVNDSLIDLSGGLEDLKAGRIRMIGDPEARLLEDPIRILRAVRLAHMIRFQLDEALRSAMAKHASSLLQSALPRRREEILKFLRLDNPALPFLESYDLGLLEYMAPTLHELFSHSEKSQDFVTYLQAFHDKRMEAPFELFAGLVLAYYRSVIEPKSEVPVKNKDLLDNPKLVRLMRDELGMFKYEQSLVAKAIQMQGLLNKRAEFERRGSSRQMAILKNEAFPLALKLADRDYSLSADDLKFWHESFEKGRKEIESFQSNNNKRRRRRRRKPGPRKRPQS